MDARTSSTREMIRGFWQRDGDEYDAGSGHGVYSDRERELWSRFLGEVAVPSRVLDVGTGTGFVAVLLAELGHDVTGVDWSASMMETAAARAARAAVAVTFRVAEAEELPFVDGEFAAVTARHVLWTLLEPTRVLEEWRRVLKPGGQLVVDLSLGRGRAHYSEPVELALPMRGVDDEQSVVDLLEEAGFSGVRHERIARDGHSRPNAVFWATA